MTALILMFKWSSRTGLKGEERGCGIGSISMMSLRDVPMEGLDSWTYCSGDQCRVWNRDTVLGVIGLWMAITADGVNERVALGPSLEEFPH